MSYGTVGGCESSFVCSEGGFVSSDVLSVSNYEHGGEPRQQRASVELCSAPNPVSRE